MQSRRVCSAVACSLALGLGLVSACGPQPCPVPCPPGTTQDGDNCVPVETCGAGTHDVDGGCAPDVSCGPGTVSQGGQCVPVVAPSNDFDIRASVTTIPGDGYSKIPLLAIGREADGGVARDAVVLTVNPSYRGTISPSAFNLGPLGTQVYFTPCSSGSSPACVGPVEIVMSLASAPSAPIATTGPLAVVAQTGVGSDAPCLAGGNVLFFSGDSGDYIYPGTETVTLATWSPTISPTSAPTNVRLWITPSDSSQGLWWDMEFSTSQLSQPMMTQVYTGAERAPFASPGHPGIDIGGDGRGCNTISGKFQVEQLDVSGGALQGFTATFEQHCEGGTPALRGCVHYGTPPPP